MMETEKMKVYELAKELGLDSFSLLDKLNGLNIKVKSHMSELEPEHVVAVRQELVKKSGPAESTKKAPTRARKKAPAAAETAAAPAAAKPTAQTSSAKATASKESSIIRRRVKADGETETLVPAAVAKTTATSEYAQEAHLLDSEEQAQTSIATQDEVFEETQSAALQTQEADALSASHAVETAELTPAAPATPAPRKPIEFTPRPVAPKRSILKIVEAAAPPPRPMIKPAPTPGGAKAAGPAPRGTSSTADRDGFRIIKMNKESLDQMAEEEAAKKKGGGGGRTAEIKPEDVRFADYRKKEMVFLPRKKRLPVGKQTKRTEVTMAAEHKRVVEMGAAISIQDFAGQMNVKAIDVVRKLMQMGQMVNVNASIDFDTATLIAPEFKHEVKNISFKEEVFLEANEDQPEDLISRPPVVTIMGHVDHGKTSLLDSIRHANVAGGEAGGITQHIGAYTVEQNGQLITFVDTPGHEAFTSMRARGANVTDIVILVVAADDGVMPQTREALSHAQAANVPIIVAMNKIDKPGANPEKIKQQLAELNLLAEDWGGQTMFVPVSAIKKTNLDKLLEGVLLQAEVLDLKANPAVQAQGTVLEARLDKGRGPVASVLVKRGTLRVGDPIISGTHVGKVRAIMNHKGEPIKEVTPGMAGEVLGFETLPMAGDKFDCPVDDQSARKIISHRQDEARAMAAASSSRASLDDLFAKIQAGAVKELNVILKADVFGSVEAIRESLVKLSNDKVKIKVLFSAPGGITESDVLLASASQAIIIGFNVRPETKARQTAEAEHIEIKTYSIIYELIDDIKASMVGLLDKKKVEKFLGRAEVRQTFTVPKIGTIAGSAVVDGKILRGASVRLLRDSRIIFEGKMSSLRRFKDDAKEVAQGFECGIGIENYNDLKPGDIIEAFQIEMIAGEMTS